MMSPSIEDILVRFDIRVPINLTFNYQTSKFWRESKNFNFPDLDEAFYIHLYYIEIFEKEHVV